MSGLKAYPQVKVEISNSNIIPFQASAPLLVNDVMSGSLVAGAGDGIGLVNDLNPNISNAWFQQPSYLYINGLQFYRFAENGTLQMGSKPIAGQSRKDWAGWALKPRLAWLDCKIGANATTIADTDLTDLNWDAIAGTWRTVKNDTPRTGLAITNTKADNKKSQARTRGTIPANRSLAFDASFMGQSNNTDPPDARIQWGDFSGGQYSLVFEDRASIGLDKAISESSSGGATTVTTTWNRVMTFDAIPPANMGGGRYLCSVLRISGRMVIVINGQAFWYVERRVSGATTPFRSSTAENVELVDVGWGEGKIQVEANSAAVRLEVGVIKYISAGGELNTGSFRKSINRVKALSSIENVATKSGGWKKAGTKVEVTCGEGGLSYDCTLTANADGIDTPFVSKCLLKSGTVYTNPVSTTIDFAGAVRSIKVAQALPSPDNTQGSTLTLELDALAARRITNDFLDYITPYREIKVSVRWLDGDGVVQGSYIPLFQGVTTSIRDNIQGHSQHVRTLGGRDATVLLQQPAHGIDHRYPPLDFDMMEKVGGAFGGVNQVPNANSGAYYDYDAARAILNVELPFLAESMEVIVPPSHPPLIASGNDNCGYYDALSLFTDKNPYENGFIFPPKYKSYLGDWLRDFNTIHQTSIFIAPPESNRYGWPILKWVRLPYWLQLSGRLTHRAPDRVYLSGDEEKAFAALEVESKPDMDYNHFWAGSTPPSTDLGGLLPDLRMSEAYLMTGPSVAWRSWRRTYFLENPMAWVGGAGVAGVDALARFTRDELEGVPPIWPMVSLPGDATIQPGDKLFIKRSVAGAIIGSGVPDGDSVPGGYPPRATKDYSSPAGLDGLVETTARIQAVSHEIDLATVGLAQRYTTVPQLRPLLSSGI